MQPDEIHLRIHAKCRGRAINQPVDMDFVTSQILARIPPPEAYERLLHMLGVRFNPLYKD
jgi:hypothetical protein